MRLAIGLIAVVLLAAAMPVALSATLDESAEPETVVNETFTPSTGQPVVLDESERDDVLYNRTVAVYNSSDVLITQPNNYTWISSNGTIDIQRNGQLDGEPSANITYGYADATEDQVALQGLFSEIPQTLGLIIPVFIVLLFLRVLVG